MTQQPQAKYRHDYRAPEYLISDIDLTFDLDAAKTVVTAESKVSRHAAASDVPLRLDGEDLTLIALQVNGQPWSDYKEENNQLVIGGLPEHFTLTIVNEISPAANTALEGLYQSGEALCTQCEAEGVSPVVLPTTPKWSSIAAGSLIRAGVASFTEHPAVLILPVKSNAASGVCSAIKKRSL